MQNVPIPSKEEPAPPPTKRGRKPGSKHPRRARALTSISEDDVLLTSEEVRVFFGGPSRPLDLATIYRGGAQGRYPLPIQIGPNSVRWLLSECRASRQRMLAARGQPAEPQAPAGTEAA
jgi:predicted DNA-binding transcriptional regulator AlpA